jgi:hypothetical protein
VRIRKDDVDAKNIDWHAWGLAKNKKPIDGGDGFLYCCKEGQRLFKAASHKACRYHNEAIRDKGNKRI